VWEPGDHHHPNPSPLPGRCRGAPPPAGVSETSINGPATPGIDPRGHHRPPPAHRPPRRRRLKQVVRGQACPLGHPMPPARKRGGRRMRPLPASQYAGPTQSPIMTCSEKSPFPSNSPGNVDCPFHHANASP
jgi:hypothetical protein